LDFQLDYEVQLDVGCSATAFIILKARNIMALAGSGVEDGLCFLFEIFEIFEIFAPNVQLVWRGRGKTKKKKREHTREN
jgi:hypothetical protein